MLTIRRLAALALLALLLAPLAACGGAQPATIASIPVYPGAAEIPAGENAMVDTVAESMQSAGGGPLGAELRRYSLPAGTTWEDVEAHYAAGLAGAGWRAAPDLAGSDDALRTAGWQHGGDADEQVLLVGLLPEELAGEPVLLVALFSE